MEHFFTTSPKYMKLYTMMILIWYYALFIKFIYILILLLYLLIFIAVNTRDKKPMLAYFYNN